MARSVLAVAVVVAAAVITLPGTARAGSPPPDLDWAVSFGSTEFDGPGRDIVTDDSGNVYSVGSFQGTVDFDPGPGTANLSALGLNAGFVVKLDAAGNLVWAKGLGPSGLSTAGSGAGATTVALDGDGNVVVAGTFEGTVDFDPGPGSLVLKSEGETDVFVAKLGPGGDVLWAVAVGGTFFEFPVAVDTDDDGRIHVTGTFEGTVDFDPSALVRALTSAGSRDVFVLVLNGGGAFERASAFGGNGFETPQDLVLDGAGNTLISGAFEGTVDFDPGAGMFPLTAAGESDAFLVKLDAGGALVWARALGGPESETGWAVDVDAAWNVYWAGQFQDTASYATPPTSIGPAVSSDVFVVKLDPDADLLWARVMGGPGPDIPIGMAVDGAGSAVVAGTFSGSIDFDAGPAEVMATSNGGLDAFVAAINESGTLLWAGSAGGDNDEIGYDVAITDSGVIVNGEFFGMGDFDPGPGVTELTSNGERDVFVARLKPPAVTAGLVDPSQGRWHLRNSTGQVTSFFFGNPGDVPVMGDWDCDGVDTPGLFRTSDAFAYLSNANRSQIADIRFFFGNPDDVPLAGDWDGDGCDTMSIYRPAEQRFYIINGLGENDGGLGLADFFFSFGNPGDKPVAGDWDGDGIDEVGLHRESTGFFYWRNTLTTGVADGEIFFGDPADRFVAGDWGIIDGVDTPAIFRPSDMTFYRRHTLTQGTADSQSPFPGAASTWLPVAGHFGLG